MYKVSITSQDVEIYQQSVEELDIMAAISAVNQAQLLKRNRRALRSDAGTKRTVRQVMEKIGRDPGDSFE